VAQQPAFPSDLNGSEGKFIYRINGEWCVIDSAMGNLDIETQAADQKQRIVIVGERIYTEDHLRMQLHRGKFQTAAALLMYAALTAQMPRTPMPLPKEPDPVIAATASKPKKNRQERRAEASNNRRRK
jgi:hypothetical protein